MSEILFLGAGIMSAANLVLGYFLGRRSLQSRSNPPGDRALQLNQITAQQLDEYSHRVKAASLHLYRVKSIVTPGEREIHAIELLLQANKQLQQDLLETRRKLKANRDRRFAELMGAERGMPTIDRPTLTDDQPEVSSAPSRMRADQCSSQVDAVTNKVGNQQTRGCSIQVKLSIAPYDSGKLPKEVDFYPVDCCDFSSDGFSFRVDSPPSFKWLVAAFTKPSDRTYYSARVSSVAEFIEREKTQYHVTCHSTGRMHHHLFE